MSDSGRPRGRPKSPYVTLRVPVDVAELLDKALERLKAAAPGGMGRALVITKGDLLRAAVREWCRTDASEPVE